MDPQLANSRKQYFMSLRLIEKAERSVRRTVKGLKTGFIAIIRSASLLQKPVRTPLVLPSDRREIDREGSRGD
ncbi:hypothetical protein CK230_29830 [Mesorhizobium sp. WSM3859]|nr:hypothetical protein CK230_29830 [Mesorhizobium sp. WSM3859]